MADTKLELPLRLAKRYRQRRFDAPHPPQLSRSFSKKHWSIYSSRVAAKLRDDKSGFDTVPVGSRSGAYRFRPPSKAPDYPYHLGKYDMQVLEAAGFLNHQNQGMSGNIDGQLAFEYWRNRDHNPDLQKRIHPVWRLAQWVNLTPHQYPLMTPALLLASAILDDPVTLNYFYALAMPIDSMDTVSHVSNGLKADCKIMKIPDVLPEGEDFWTFMKLDLATLYIRDWGFEDGLECFAYTARYMDSLGEFAKGSGPDTFGSFVRLDSAFIKVLEYFEAGQTSEDDKYSRIFDDIQTMAGIHTTRRAPISHASAMYRTYFLLAQSLVHEFAHAFSYAYFPRSNRGSRISQDPFVPGNRANEQGFALENYIFGGVIQPPIVNIPPMNPAFAQGLQSVVAPWGFQTNLQWDVWASNTHNPNSTIVRPAVMDSDRKIGERRPADRLYPVPQAWVQWLFSDDLWTDYVHRYGLQAIKVPKLQEWEIRVHNNGTLGYYGTGEDRWNTGTPRLSTQNWE